MGSALEVVLEHQLDLLVGPQVALQGEEAAPFQFTEKHVIGGIESEMPADLAGEEEGLQGELVT